MGADTVATSDLKGAMPSTEEIPLPLEHRLVIPSPEENEVRFVNNECSRWTRMNQKSLIIRCRICGHDSEEGGLMRSHAWQDHEMHFQRDHVGTKIVWHDDDLPGAFSDALNTSPVIRESFHYEDDNEWDQYLFKAKGDITDERAAEIGADKVDEDNPDLLIEHRPPIEPYEGSVEEGCPRDVYYVDVPSEDDE